MLEKIAKSVVRESLKVKSRDVVIVSTYQHTIDLAEALAKECFNVGADVLMTLDTDNVYYHHLRVLPLSNLKQTSAHCLGLAEYTTVQIYIGGPEDPAPMKKIPPEKFSALFEGEKGHTDKALEKKIRISFLSIGLVTPQRAKTYGFDYSRWRRMVERASMVSPKEMARFGRKVARVLEKGNEVHITSKQGTDLTFELGERPVHINDGILDKADLDKGTNFVTLPSGDVTVAPLEKSGKGKVFFDVPVPIVGKLVRDLRWTFEKGKVKEFKARTNLKVIKSFFDKGHGAKDMLGSFTLGINPNAKTGYLMSSMAMGAVTIAIGENREIGGKNESDYSASGTISRPTVTVDGKLLIKNGKYTI